MFQKSNSDGFGLIELLIALAIIAVMASVALPNIGRLIPRYEREKFLARLNKITRFAAQNAIKRGAIHRVEFNLATRKIAVAVASDERERDGDFKFEPLTRDYGSASISIPDTIDIKNIFIEKFDEMKRSASVKTTETWFYIVPEGLSQEVTINFLDTKDKKERKPRQFGLVLNPFTTQFTVYDAFQK